MNSRKRLITFAGKPGVGKSSIIKKLSDGYMVIDVWDFMVPHIESGDVPPEEKNILGYKAMYEHLAKTDVRQVMLELGTNYPDFNIAELNKLTPHYDIDLILCEAPVEICRARAKERGFRSGGEGTERRFKRDFPNTFLKELENSSLRHHIFSTEGDIETVCALLKERFEI